MKKILFWIALHHPWVQENIEYGVEMTKKYHKRSELFMRASEECEQAQEDAKLMYDHLGEVVDIIEMYQKTLSNLCLPDPHGARVRMVARDFKAQYEERYG